MPTHFQLSWVQAVKEWNQNQAFHNDIYAIPKKGGESYKEVISLREGFKRQHNAPQISGKKITNEIQKLFFSWRQATGNEKTKLHNKILKLEEERKKYQIELTPKQRAELKKFNEENDEYVW